MTEDKILMDNLYRNLLGVVRVCVHERIDQERIDKTINSIIEVFQEKLYSPLLLYIYKHPEGNYIYSHIANNVILSIAFSQSLGLSKEEIKDVGLCAFGHDFGMVSFLELTQKPSQLTLEENQTIHHHPIKSAELFAPFFPEKVIEGILDIHECVNGKGYPRGKAGADISFLAKVVSVCDVFEALTHPRNFRNAFSPYEAVKMIIKKKDQMFDKRVVKKFVEFMSIYPIGNLVKLNTGEAGMVIAGNPGFPTRSVVRVLLNPKHEADLSGKVIDLFKDPMVYINGPVDAKEAKEILNLSSLKF